MPLHRWSFNITLFLAGVFGLAAGGSPNFITLASLLAVLGLGVGGNLPIDSAVFLDFVPGTHQYLLTILSIWWSIGQLVSALVSPRCHRCVLYCSDWLELGACLHLHMFRMSSVMTVVERMQLVDHAYVTWFWKSPC